jgi:hypothetical protein
LHARGVEVDMYIKINSKVKENLSNIFTLLFNDITIYDYKALMSKNQEFCQKILIAFCRGAIIFLIEKEYAGVVKILILWYNFITA